MSQPRRKFALASSVALLACGVLSAPQAAHAQNVIHSINDSHISYSSALTTTGSTFTTDFKGVNDVKITLNSGVVSAAANITSSPAGTNSNNPAFLSSFVGNATQGTGDGTMGTMTFLSSNIENTSYTKLTFDFVGGLSAGDKLLIDDIDASDVVSIQAYSYSSSGGSVSLLDMSTSVTATNYTGADSSQPNGNYPSYAAGGTGNQTGTWTGTGARLGNEISALAFNVPVSEVIVTRTGGASNSGMGFQFYSNASAPEPGSFVMAGMGLAGLGVTAIRRRRGRRSVTGRTIAV